VRLQGQDSRKLGPALSERCCSRSTRNDVPATNGGAGAGAAGALVVGMCPPACSCARRRPPPLPSSRRRRRCSAASRRCRVSGRPCGGHGCRLQTPHSSALQLHMFQAPALRPPTWRLASDRRRRRSAAGCRASLRWGQDFITHSRDIIIHHGCHKDPVVRASVAGMRPSAQASTALAAHWRAPQGSCRPTEAPRRFQSVHVDNSSLYLARLLACKAAPAGQPEHACMMLATRRTGPVAGWPGTGMDGWLYSSATSSPAPPPGHL